MDIIVLKEQYGLITQSREVLLNYCATIAPEDLKRIKSSFGAASISYLLAHMANCYLFWIGKTGLQHEVEFIDYDQLPSLTEQRAIFREIDAMMGDFLNRLKKEKVSEVPFITSDAQGVATPLQLFTHVTTHEFHHKGQLLTLSRQLGYIPVDTDIMR